MYKLLLIFLALYIISCKAQGVETQEPRGKYHLHKFYHYWIFLAIKAKIVFLIATFLSLWVFAGKAFAYLYYISNKSNCKCPEIRPEKIYVSPPHFDGPDFHQRFSPGYDTISPQLKRNTFTNNYNKKRFGRRMQESLMPDLGAITSIAKKIDLTQIAFNSIGLKTETCKKRFVCEAEENAKSNSIFALGLYLFSDTGLNKYRSNETIENIQDCFQLYPECELL